MVLGSVLMLGFNAELTLTDENISKVFFELRKYDTHNCMNNKTANVFTLCLSS